VQCAFRVQSTQRTRLQTRPFVRGINNLLKLGVNAPMLTHVWQELEYRNDVCRITRGAHNPTSLVVKKKCFRVPVAVNNSIKVGPLVLLA
jgi:hypothetical protein